MWIEILKKSYIEDLKIKKNTVLGFIVIEPENSSQKHKTPKSKKKKKKKKVLPKTWNEWIEKNNNNNNKRKQRGRFLSKYDFAYASTDTVDQAAKVASGVIKQATNEIDEMVKNRIDQTIKSGGAEIERVLPKIICGAIEDVYKTPFRLLGNLGKQQFQKIKKKILR